MLYSKIQRMRTRAMAQLFTRDCSVLTDISVTCVEIITQALNYCHPNNDFIYSTPQHLPQQKHNHHHCSSLDFMIVRRGAYITCLATTKC